MKKNAIKQICFFVLITYLSSFLLALPSLNIGTKLENVITSPSLSNTQILSFVLLVFYMWMPALGSVITKAVTKQSIKNELHSLRIRKTIKLYILGWFSPLLFASVGTTTYFLLFPKQFDSGLIHLHEFLNKAGITLLDNCNTVTIFTILILIALLSAPAGCIISGIIGEEIGWRGYLFPMLLKVTSPRKAIIFSGLIWGIWHTPLIIMGWDYGTGYWGFPLSGIAVLTLCCICIGAILNYLTFKANSIWPGTLLHSTTNTIFSLYLLSNGFCKEAFNPLIGTHSLTLVGGWLIILAGGIIIGKANKLFPIVGRTDETAQ